MFVVQIMSFLIVIQFVIGIQLFSAFSGPQPPPCRYMALQHSHRSQTNVEHRVGPCMAGKGRWVPSRPPVGIWLVGTVIGARRAPGPT